MTLIFSIPSVLLDSIMHYRNKHLFRKKKEKVYQVIQNSMTHDELVNIDFVQSQIRGQGEG